jgi:DNA-binding protein YbaB
LADSRTSAPRKYSDNSTRRLADDPARRSAEAMAGGGMVRVTVDGLGVLRRLDLDRDVFEGRDPDLLADLIMSAISEAQRRVVDDAQDAAGSRGLAPAE